MWLHNVMLWYVQALSFGRMFSKLLLDYSGVFADRYERDREHFDEKSDLKGSEVSEHKRTRCSKCQWVKFLLLVFKFIVFRY